MAKRVITCVGTLFLAYHSSAACLTHATVLSTPCLQIFEEYRDIWDWGRSWTIEEWSANPQSVDAVKSLMARQRGRRDKLERMKVGAVVGCLYVDSKPMKAELVPVVSNTQDKLKLYLLTLARTHCLAALEQLQERNNLLAQRPTVLAEFMEYKVRCLDVIVSSLLAR